MKTRIAHFALTVALAALGIDLIMVAIGSSALLLSNLGQTAYCVESGCSVTYSAFDKILMGLVPTACAIAGLSVLFYLWTKYMEAQKTH